MDNKADIVWRAFFAIIVFSVVIIAFLVLAGMAVAQPQARPCVSGGTPMGDVASAISRLEKEYGETPRFMGIIPKTNQTLENGDNKDAIFMMFLDPKDGSWTMGYYKDQAQFCFITGGQGAFLLEFDPGIPGKDA